MKDMSSAVPIQIREAVTNDIAEILAIYNEVVANTTAIYEDEPGSPALFEALLAERRAGNFPFFVAVQDNAVLGYSTFGPWRTRVGYRTTVEHSVQVHADARGRGVGRALISALFPVAEQLGLHRIVANIDSEATASLYLHKSLGFKEVGTFPEIAQKFGHWLNLVTMVRDV